MEGLDMASLHKNVAKWTENFDMFQENFVLVLVYEKCIWSVAIIINPKKLFKTESGDLVANIKRSANPGNKITEILDQICSIVSFGFTKPNLDLLRDYVISEAKFRKNHTITKDQILTAHARYDFNEFTSSTYDSSVVYFLFKFFHDPMEILEKIVFGVEIRNFKEQNVASIRKDLKMRLDQMADLPPSNFDFNI